MGFKKSQKTSMEMNGGTVHSAKKPSVGKVMDDVLKSKGPKLGKISPQSTKMGLKPPGNVGYNAAFKMGMKTSAPGKLIGSTKKTMFMSKKPGGK